MGLFADNFKKGKKKHISKWFSRKINNSKDIKDQLVFLPFARQYCFCQTFFRKSYKISKFLYFFHSVCFKPHANPTIINENIKEIHILTVGGILEFPILNDVLLRNFNQFTLERIPATSRTKAQALTQPWKTSLSRYQVSSSY